MSISFHQLMKKKKTIEQAVEEKLIDELAEYFPINEDKLIEELQDYFPPTEVEEPIVVEDPVVTPKVDGTVDLFIEESVLEVPEIVSEKPPEVVLPIEEVEINEVVEPKYVDIPNNVVQAINESNERICNTFVESLQKLKSETVKGWQLDIIRNDKGIIVKIDVTPKE